MPQQNSHPVTLTVAGSDSGGGAGIQADLKTMTALGAFGVSVIAALTAQHGAGVLGIHETPPDFVTLQMKAIRTGFPVRAAKTGMLASASIIEAVADSLKERDFPLVVDPVCMSQSGHSLLRDDALQTLVRRLLPLADLLTPNRPEAELLTGFAVNNAADVKKAAKRLLEMGARAVLVKGGHFEGGHFEQGGGAETSARKDARRAGEDTLIDWLVLPGREPLPLAHARVETPNNHGTGCTLSAAIATFLAFGLPLEEAVKRAQVFLVKALATSFSPGIGAGPPNFMGGAGLLG